MTTSDYGLISINR